MNHQITPLLSIVIATKNRVPYCINAIESILALNQNNFELVVQDNTDNFELKEYIESHISDVRLVYQYIPPPFSSIDNFNAVMSMAKGDYVCMIGDDDGINPEIFEIVTWAKKNNVDSITPTIYASYIWPDAHGNNFNGLLTLNKFSSTIKKINPLENLLPLIEKGIVDYQNFNLPKVYHGIVKRSCFEKIFKTTGHYFGGLSPDIYSAVALACVVDSHYIIDYPFTISGACIKSTTVDNWKGKHSGYLFDAPHFRDRGYYKWDELIPEYYSVQTIWAESAIKAFREMNVDQNINKFGLKYLVSNSLIYNKGIFFLILNQSYKLKTVKKNFVQFNLSLLFCVFKIYIKKIKNRLNRKPVNDTEFIQSSNVQNIVIATQILQHDLIKNNSFSCLDLN